MTYRTAASLLLAAALAGCSTPPAIQFYSLGAPLATPTAPRSGPPLLIELAPLALPERLQRPHIVVRNAHGQLDVLELQRWASPFGAELRDALAAGIAQQLGAVDISGGGRLAGQPVYRISVQLRQWDAQLGQPLQARFSWTLRRSDDLRNLACQSSHTEPVGPGVAALAQGAQALAAHAAQRIANTLAALDADATSPCPE